MVTSKKKRRVVKEAEEKKGIPIELLEATEKIFKTEEKMREIEEVLKSSEEIDLKIELNLITNRMCKRYPSLKETLSRVLKNKSLREKTAFMRNLEINAKKIRSDSKLNVVK